MGARVGIGGEEKLPGSLEARAIDNPGLTRDGPVRGEADDHLHRHALGADRGGGSAPAAQDLVVQKNLDRDGSLVWRAPDLLLHAPDIEENVCHAILAAEGRRGAYRSEEHTSELQSLMRISYAVFCLKKKKKNIKTSIIHITT